MTHYEVWQHAMEDFLSKLKFSYTVLVNIELSKAEVDVLMKLSASHYDGLCKSIGHVGGFLYGMKNSFMIPGRTADRFELSSDKLDLLNKILEQASYLRAKSDLNIATNLMLKLSKAFSLLVKENARIAMDTTTIEARFRDMTVEMERIYAAVGPVGELEATHDIENLLQRIKEFTRLAGLYSPRH